VTPVIYLPVSLLLLVLFFAATTAFSVVLLV